MDFVRFGNLNETISVEVGERDSGGEIKIERLFKPTDLGEYVSVGIVQENFTGNYYYRQEEISSQLSHVCKILESDVVAFKTFCSAVRPPVPSLVDIAGTYILNDKCTSTFECFQKQYLEGKIPAQLIEHVHLLYQQLSLRNTTDQKYRAILPDELGIVQEQITKHLPDLLPLAPPTTEPHRVFSEENVKKMIELHYYGHAKCHMSIKLPSKANEPQITLTTDSKAAFLVPWTITFKDPNAPTLLTRISWSPEVGKWVYQMFCNTLPPALRQLLTPKESVWYEQVFWKNVLAQL